MKKGLSKIALALFAAGFAFNVSAVDIKVAVASDATSLDPQEQLSGQTLEMSHLVFDPLMRYTQDLQFEPRLAGELLLRVQRGGVGSDGHLDVGGRDVKRETSGEQRHGDLG